MPAEDHQQHGAIRDAGVGLELFSGLSPFVYIGIGLF